MSDAKDPGIAFRPAPPIKLEPVEISIGEKWYRYAPDELPEVREIQTGETPDGATWDKVKAAAWAYARRRADADTTVASGPFRWQGENLLWRSPDGYERCVGGCGEDGWAIQDPYSGVTQQGGAATGTVGRLETAKAAERYVSTLQAGGTSRWLPLDPDTPLADGWWWFRTYGKDPQGTPREVTGGHVFIPSVSVTWECFCAQHADEYWPEPLKAPPFGRGQK